LKSDAAAVEKNFGDLIYEILCEGH